ncbi:ABC transporter ATP-binding protein [Arenimonas sp.]|uniref:ABC transporter ATP-binding protein n=1 Tax=Arenimonas sp. TaxID=1872635 RepID=UPI0025CD2AD5|nr:ABC transporter ATP-binding protein [Arenimonas sp.]
MSSDDAVIVARGLSKAYQVYASPRARLQQFLLPRLRRLAGLPPRNHYRDFHALRGIDLSVGRGETVGIIGRNGSGKSTLLQLICGTLTPSGGSVSVRGRVAALLELGSGFNPEFSGRENVFLNGALLGLSRREVEQRFDAIAAFADIGEFIDQPTKTYSSGMVVRLAFAVAIHVDPDLLVVDEALAVGDTAFQQKCLQRIRRLQDQGVSILLVTHSTNTLIEYCDRGVYLRRGQLVMDGPCREVVKAYGDDLLAEEGAIGVVVAAEPEAGPQAPTPPAERAQADAGASVAVPAPAPHAILQIEQVALLDADGRPAATVRSGDAIEVLVDLRVHEPVAQPCFGIQLSSTDGIVLWSATTQQLASTLAPMAPGRHRFRWRLQANFSGNRYVVAIGAGEIVGGEYKRRHRLDYAGHFDVIPEPRSGGGWLAPKPSFALLPAAGAGEGDGG